MPKQLLSGSNKNPWLQRSKWKISYWWPGQGKKSANYWLVKILPCEVALTVSEAVWGSWRLPWLGHAERTPQQESHMKSYFGSGVYHAGISPNFHLFHSPWDSIKSQGQMSFGFLLHYFFWLGYRDRSWLCVAQGKCRRVKFTASFLIHLEWEWTHSSLPSRQQQLPGPLLFYISLFVNDAPPGWLKVDETASVSVSPPLMDTASDTGNCFEEQGMDDKFQQTWESERHPPGGGGNSQTGNFQGALALRGDQSSLIRNISYIVYTLT